MPHVDLLIIGAGTAGEYAARAAASRAGSVAVVERGQVGGDCVFHACIPTKALLQAALIYQKVKDAWFYGLPAVEDVPDYRRVKSFKDKIVNSMGSGRAERLEQAGIQLLHGMASFISPHEVRVNGDTIMADKIIIATGSHPFIPAIKGLKQAGYITSVEALELEAVPARLAVLGGGPVGMEFAQIFSAFGSKVRVYEAAEKVLGGEDEEVTQAIASLAERQGIRIATSVSVTEVSRTSSGKVVVVRERAGGESREEFDELLVATGRSPALEELDLPAAGVEVRARGIAVDAALQTSVPHIWAAGDVTGVFLFTNVAGEQGRTAALNATASKRRELDYSILPRVTFCNPEVASVGLTEYEARQQGYRVVVGRFSYARLTRAVITGETEGFIKIVAEESSGRILGGHIAGADASEVIHEIAAALAGKLSVSDVSKMLHAYPTFSEGVRYACMMAGRNTRP